MDAMNDACTCTTYFELPTTQLVTICMITTKLKIHCELVYYITDNANFLFIQILSVFPP